MDAVTTEIIKDTKLEKFESHQDFIENDASDYESINSDNDDNYRKEDNSDYESDTLQNTEREEGDGQESIPPKKVDDDEDKKNPQYIPKRGAFYEHDDRTLDENESESTDKKQRQSKKSIWIEKKERWGHDRYNETEQVPKSRTELIGIYGYDIRNEDGPPRARRRRRYGRGPNKYTRTWEDEDAYKPARPRPVRAFEKKSSTEDLSPLEPHVNDSEEEALENPEIIAIEKEPKRGPNMYTRTWEDEDAYKSARPRPVRAFGKKSSTEELPPPEPRVNDSEEEPVENPESIAVEKEPSVSYGTSDIIKSVEIEQKIETITPKQDGNVPAAKAAQKEIKPADYRGFTKARQYKNLQTEQKILKKTEKVQVADSLEEDLANLSIIKRQNRQNTVPPRLQNEQKIPKRYSSIRQRSLPETAATNTFNQQTYYANDYTPPQPQQAILSQPPPATVLQQVPPPIPQQLSPVMQSQIPSTIQQQIPLTIQQQIPAPIQQVPITANALLPTPTQFAPSFPPPPNFIPAAVPTASPFIPPQPQILNYVANQPPFVQAPFQGFQQFNAVTPAAELNYQCKGGTTYYSTQNQQIGHLPLRRRPKAAIPIVPPPPPLQEPHNLDKGRSASPTADDKLYDDFYENDYEDGTLVVQ